MGLRAPVAWLLAVVSLTVAVSAAGAQTAATVATTARFDFRSDTRVGLHHFLMAWALADAGEWPAYAPPIRERNGWRDRLSADEALTWAAAVDAYAAVRDRSLLFDTGLLAVRDWAAGTMARDEVPTADRGLADALEAALHVYLRRWWPHHDRLNREWIADVAPAVRELEEAVVPRLEAAYGGSWPDGRIPVEVVAHANPVGAYSTGGRVTIASGNRNIRMPQALDIVFHEASHVESLERPLTVGVDAAFRTVGGEAPERLWHDFIFFTTGEVLRLVLEERGEPGFRHYGETAGVYSRGDRWSRELPAFRRHWQPFLRSASPDGAARRAALAAVARELAHRL